MHPIYSTIHEELSAALRGLDLHQTQLHPSGRAAGWTMQQIAEHLRLTYNQTTGSLIARVAKGHPTRSTPTTHQRIARFIVVSMGLMPGRRDAPPEVCPSPSAALTGDQICESLRLSLAQLDAATAQAELAFAAAPCMTHFALGPLSAAQWRRFHLCHTRHHIRQLLAARSLHQV